MSKAEKSPFLAILGEYIKECFQKNNLNKTNNISSKVNYVLIKVSKLRHQKNLAHCVTFPAFVYRGDFSPNLGTGLKNLFTVQGSLP